MGDKNMNIEEVIANCLSYDDEQEWFEFKSNYVEPDELGRYISSLSNSAAMLGRANGYLIFGIHDKTHEIMGTSFSPHKAVNNEPLQHYLARSLNPSIPFRFEETSYRGQRLVVLVVPAARIVPTSYLDARYIRIGSSKENLRRYPEREAALFSILTFGLPSLTSIEADRQNLTFGQLFMYYGSKNLTLNRETFAENLGFYTKDGKYNLLAQLLSDNSGFPLRVAIFSGKTKANKLYSVREFGYKCLLFSVDEIIQYGDVINIFQADESNRIVERKEVRLFDQNAFREAVVNAILHNRWIDRNEPMFSIFSDRMEILSRGSIGPLQTKEGFFKGHSIPVNEKLSEIFLQVHISEKTGRGVPVIAEVYGKEAFDFSNGCITVTIPFSFINKMGDKVGNKVGNKEGNKSRKRKLPASSVKVLAEIRNDPDITKAELMRVCSLGKTSIDNIVSSLRKEGYIERIGSNKTGHWEVKGMV